MKTESAGLKGLSREYDNRREEQAIRQATCMDGLPVLRLLFLSDRSQHLLPQFPDAAELEVEFQV